MMTRGPFYENDLTLTPVWINNDMSSKVWDKIAYPFPNFNIVTVEVWIGKVISSHTFSGCNY